MCICDSRTRNLPPSPLNPHCIHLNQDVYPVVILCTTFCLSPPSSAIHVLVMLYFFLLLLFISMRQYPFFLFFSFSYVSNRNSVDAWFLQKKIWRHFPIFPVLDVRPFSYCPGDQKTGGRHSSRETLSWRKLRPAMILSFLLCQLMGPACALKLNAVWWFIYGPWCYDRSCCGPPSSYLGLAYFHQSNDILLLFFICVCVCVCQSNEINFVSSSPLFFVFQRTATIDAHPWRSIISLSLSW